MSRGRPPKKALEYGPDRVRKIVALYQDSERKGAWTGGKAVIGAKQMQDVADLLGAGTPAWFQDRLAGNYGHHGFLDYREAKQILTLIEALALKAQPADAAGGSLADREGGKGVGAAPQGVAQEGPQDSQATVLARQVIQDWLESAIGLGQRQLKAALTDRARTRADHERLEQSRAYNAALIKLAGVLLDSLAVLTPDGWRLKAGADCPWCGERNEVAFPLKIDAEHEGLVDVDTLETCTACGRGFQAQLVSYLATSQAEGWQP